MRLALKTLTYASMHLTVAVAVAYALTRDWRIALDEALARAVRHVLKVWRRATVARRGRHRPLALQG